MRDHELTSDREAEPGTTRIVALDEPVEDIWQERGIDPATGVADLQADPVAFHAAGDDDPTPGRCVAQGVGDEVREDLADPDRIDLEDREVARDLGAQLDPGCGCGRLERAHDVADQDVGIGRFRVEGECPCL